MNKTFSSILICFFYISFGSSNIYAQISASTTSGCAPLVGVQFTGVAGATSVQWDFNDLSFSNLLNPTHTFANIGTYNVHFTGTVNGSPVSHFITIEVFGKPTPVFTNTSPTSGCLPLLVNFSSTSTGGGGTSITNHSWTFGDGGANTANNANPAYLYTIPGQFNVTLIVTDANGCDSSLTINNMVSASNKPIPVITSNPNPSTSCTFPFIVTFNASSSVSNSTTGSTLTYNWNFGNGNTSTLVNPPTQTYTANGTYPVKLIVTDNNNCSDSTLKNVIIANPFASFAVADTVCKTVFFDASASFGGNKNWNYGDGFSGTSPTHTYANGGNYTVTLTVTAGTCVDDTIINIFVEDVLADFDLSPTYACSLPQTINLNNNSVNGSTYEWNFFSDSTHYEVTPVNSTLFSPSILISNLDTNRYTVNKEDYILNIQLIVTSPHGCIDSITKTALDTIYLPTARLQPDVTHGCAPLTVAFSDSSISKETIVNWEYHFGDGTIINPASPNETHTYTNPGLYEAMLIITNSAGCIDTSYAIFIYVGAPPTPNFSVSPTNACINTPISFTDLSTSNGTPIDTWHYNTDNNFFMSSCYEDPNPTWSFVGSTGSQDITLVACSYGCCDEFTISNAITINGPLAQFKTQMDCDTPMDYTFTAEIQDADYWTWDLGDGTVLNNSTQLVVNHTYTSTGDYLAQLIAYNNTSGCQPDTFSVNVYVKEIQALFTNDTIFCTNQGITFNASASVDVHTFTNNGYVWLWGDNTPPTITSSSTPSHSFATAGNYNVKLIVTDINGCRDTITREVRASAVAANFNPDSYYGCTPWTVNFTDLSTSDTTITSWSWQFGDGATGNGQVQSHTYTNTIPNSFTVTLTAQNIIGCTNTFSTVLTPSKPLATFTPEPNTLATRICAGDNVNFQPYFTGHSNYSWSFGDGNTSTATSPLNIYANSGSYTVTLTVTDSIGCQRTLTKNALINVQEIPQAGFTITPSPNNGQICGGASSLAPIITFTDTSIASVFQSRQWDLGNGSPTVGSPVVQIPNPAAGIYTATLTVTTTHGCTDVATFEYEIIDPQADFNISNPVICKGDSVTFTLVNTTQVDSWNWDFGDGTNLGSVTPVTHQYNYHPPGGDIYITLVYYSANATCEAVLTKNLKIEQVIADFDRNAEDSNLGAVALLDTAHCLGITDIFNSNSINASTWAWNFGNGATSTMENPTNVYDTAGTYIVSLNITNAIT
ncbi:MAG: PKD domain-containing protein, partial [Bacteroidota bacterium]|nr:PKD domain-containing protein [Bacteroidota bacterium]